MTTAAIGGTDESIRRAIGTHVEERHPLELEVIQTLLEEHRELYDEVAPLARDTNEKVTLLVDDMYGIPKPTAANPAARDGGWVPILRSMQENGINVRKTWTPAQWVFFGTLGAALISTCGVIISTILGG